MCDYCDCRSHPQIASLSADHEALLSLLSDLRRAVDAGQRPRARVAIARIHGLLDGHAMREEHGVFAELRKADVDHSYLAAFQSERLALHDPLDQISGFDWRRRTQAFIELLTEHIAREESDLFPAAHQLLEPRQWDAVDVATASGGAP